MDIHHDKKNQRVWTELNGYTAEVRYELTDGTVDIFHTYVPEPLGGQGIASKLVEYVYNYSSFGSKNYQQPAILRFFRRSLQTGSSYQPCR